jgi:predicted ABC-type transport system involved in lysophospholipase L1 biosynthesis ATPase subunit
VSCFHGCLLLLLPFLLQPEVDMAEQLAEQLARAAHRQSLDPSFPSPFATERQRRAVASLSRVGLASRLDHKPHQLSGGERQRVAIARATVSDPTLLLADEPTGNLDERSGAGVMKLLHELNALGTTIVVITHNLQLAAQTPRQITIRDGHLVEDARARV